MIINTKSIAILAVAVLLSIAPASAATYKLTIKEGYAILKIYLDNGVARRVAADSDTVTFDVEMNGNECVADLRLAFTNAQPLRVNNYNVCSETGFGLSLRTIRF